MQKYGYIMCRTYGFWMRTCGCGCIGVWVLVRNFRQAYTFSHVLSMSCVYKEVGSHGYCSEVCCRRENSEPSPHPKAVNCFLAQIDFGADVNLCYAWGLHFPLRSYVVYKIYFIAEAEMHAADHIFFCILVICTCGSLMFNWKCRHIGIHAQCEWFRMATAQMYI